MPMRRLILGTLAASLASACSRTAVTTSAMSSANGGSSITSGYDAVVADGISKLRAATAAFQNVDSAVAAGYPRTVAACLVHEHHGAMGYHHVNSKNVDAKAEIDKPEILL